jgi:hypothetical protein
MVAPLAGRQFAEVFKLRDYLALRIRQALFNVESLLQKLRVRDSRYKEDEEDGTAMPEHSHFPR